MKTHTLPRFDTDHLITGYRTEDVLVGPLAQFYYNMTFAGHYVCKKSFHIKRAQMLSSFLLLTTEGEGEVYYGDQKYHLIPNSVMLIDTQNSHEYYALCDGWTFKYLHFQGAMSIEYQSYIQNQFGPVIYVSKRTGCKLEEYLDAILQETSTIYETDYAVVSSYIYSILTLLLAKNNINCFTGKSSEAMQLALTYISENFQKNITTQEIANAAHLSNSYLSELFRKIYDIGPHEYLTMYRLTQVKQRLFSGTESISQIAEQTGFRDIYMLSRVFKQKFGLSPSEYRKQLWNL